MGVTGSDIFPGAFGKWMLCTDSSAQYELLWAEVESSCIRMINEANCHFLVNSLCSKLKQLGICIFNAGILCKYLILL